MDRLIDDWMMCSLRLMLKVMGPILVISVYCIVGLHLYAYLWFIMRVLPRRLGTEFAYVWASIGLILVYNIVYNHFLATVVKPSGPADLR
jgi:hypothetical protein